MLPAFALNEVLVTILVPAEAEFHRQAENLPDLGIWPKPIVGSAEFLARHSCA
jgi:hypothetical protein